MDERVVMASEFKQRCLALLDEVERTGVPVVVTKRGRAVARVVAMAQAERGRPTIGSVSLLEPGDEPYFSAGEEWAAEK
jgi:prevent-host-death family protein